MIAQLMWIIFTRSVLTDGFSFSSFTKTRITNTLCKRTNELQILQVRTLIECTTECSGNPNCRRFRYCSSNSTCVLYQDGTHCEMSSVSKTCSCYRKVIGCRDTGCTCPLGYYGNNCENIVQDCREAWNRGFGGTLTSDQALVYIQPNVTYPPSEVACILDYGGGLVMLSRMVDCYSETFNRSMAEYEQGFGLARFNRWVGLNMVMAVLEARPSSVFQLQVMLFYSENTYCSSYYYNFHIENKASRYIFTYSLFSPGTEDTCGNALANQQGFRFSTYDDDTTTQKCTTKLGGGWWFNNGSDCTTAFLTGTMDTTDTGNFWHPTLRDKLIQKIILMIWVV